MKLHIISGGQTGVDRAALDSAFALGLPYRGFVPKGRLAEDGVIAAKYTNLVETVTEVYEERTEQNVLWADVLLIFWPDNTPISGGTCFAVDVAMEHRKPMQIVNVVSDEIDDGQVDELLKWLYAFEVDELTINIGGPRESQYPGIYQRVFTFMNILLNK
ncbi:hypothetical protein HK100_008464 [Physocladia obscura]|uniref:Molybdenum cofactor carrier n=1 Tax=Physocladia obscura TaxID=109957 RepID=A0AAD5T550_9FUNG|nr:hypothetical protein HK100_008464 [Physocladia obscura]